MKKLGFKDFYEVGLGGDMTAAAEAEEWAEAYKEGKKMTTSCCPAFVNMIRKHFPELEDNISSALSPMAAVSRWIKTKEPDAICVFIGPCISKKSEASEFGIEQNADYVLAYSEIRAIMAAKNVELEPADNDYQESSVYGKRFANSGGVTAAVLQSLKESEDEIDAKICVCNGAAECKKALLLMKMGKLPEDFIEGMACEGGCVGGPSSFQNKDKAKRTREAMISEADGRGVHENLSNYDMEAFSMHRD
jgi:ferredoxin hydrogenase large subunit